MNREISELEILKSILVKNISDLIEEFIADSMAAEVHEYLKWLIKKTHYLRLQKVFNPALKGKLKRGDILLADFGFNVGSEIRKIRYCIVLDVNNPVNHGSVVVVPITTFGGSQKKKIPQSCIYIGELKGLGKTNNYANVGEIRAISKQRIIKVIGQVPNEVMLNVTKNYKSFFKSRYAGGKEKTDEIILIRFPCTNSTYTLPLCTLTCNYTTPNIQCKTAFRKLANKSWQGEFKMIIFNACRIEDGKIYYFGRFVGVVKGVKALVLERYWCRELECFLEESGLVPVWVSSLPEVEKAG